jgi:hypothetical protein
MNILKEQVQNVQTIIRELQFSKTQKTEFFKLFINRPFLKVFQKVMTF